MRAAAVAVGGVIASLAFVPILGLAALWMGAGTIPTSPAAATNDIPPGALAAYLGAARTCPGLSWALLAGIGEVESDHGRSSLPGVATGANAFGAEGPMQFLPATFARYGVDAGDGDPPNPYDLSDAALAAARMLCADGATVPGGLRTAIWDYNHSEAYVDDVLSWAARYAGAGTDDAAAGVSAGAAAAAWAVDQLGRPYRWGATGPDAYDCSGLVLRAWEVAGVTLPRVAAEQYLFGRRIPVGMARVGDLVFFAPDPGDAGAVDHVGIVVAPGVMIDAPHAGAVVRVTPFYGGLMPLAVRPGG